MNNVVQFPTVFQGFPTTRKEGMKTIQKARAEFVGYVVEDIIRMMFGELANYGINIQAEGLHFKDNIFIQNALESLLLRYVGIYHPLQKISDDVIRFESEGPVKAPTRKPRKKKEEK